MRLLLVEDDVQLSKSLADRVSAAGYIVDCVVTGEQVEAAVAAVPYPLAILDRGRLCNAANDLVFSSRLRAFA